MHSPTQDSKKILLTPKKLEKHPPSFPWGQVEGGPEDIEEGEEDKTQVRQELCPPTEEYLQKTEKM